ncbi:hypothetical protein HY992_04475 [Candidatus Micrarchaeota archaeon]|nr:hypothetical protein [Candidatus Micrarchaeota archaeon]
MSKAVVFVLAFALFFSACVALDLNKPSLKVEVNECKLVGSKDAGFNVSQQVFVRNYGGKGEAVVEGWFAGAKGSKKNDSRKISFESGGSEMVEFSFKAKSDASGVCDAKARVLVDEKDLEKTIPIRSFAFNAEEQAPLTIGASCPSSCDDFNPCTRDYCGRETEYACVHYLLEGEQQGCRGASGTCARDMCEQGACVQASIPNCCGNGKCDGSEDAVACPSDCASNMVFECVSPPVILPTAARAQSSLNRPMAACAALNNESKPVVLTVSASVPGWSDEDSETIELKSGEWKVVSFNIAFKDAFYSNNEVANAKMNFKATRSGAIVFEESKDVELGAKGDVVWTINETWDNSPIVVELITPHDPCVEQVISLAKEKTPDRSLAGYLGYASLTPQTANDKTIQQSKAIYEAIQDVGISYVNTPVSFSKEAQRVRLPWESIEQKSGNCIDGTLVFASAFEDLRMNSLVILVPGHAFVGVETIPGSGTFAFIETTMLGTNSFEEAHASANAQFVQHLNAGTIKTINVSEWREAGLQPFPSNKTSCNIQTATCNDGTVSGTCSSNKPFYCMGGKLVQKASTCGCPSGKVAVNDGCVDSTVTLKDETVQLPSGYAMFYPDPTGINSEASYSYTIISSAALKVYVVDSSSEYTKFLHGNAINYHADCYEENTFLFDKQCRHQQTGGIIIANDGAQDAEVKIKILKSRE